jgi:hypothetical protein
VLQAAARRRCAHTWRATLSAHNGQSGAGMGRSLQHGMGTTNPTDIEAEPRATRGCCVLEHDPPKTRRLGCSNTWEPDNRGNQASM